MYRLGIDLGGTNIAAGVINTDHQIIGRAKIKTNAARPAEDIIYDIAQAARTAVSDAGLSMEQISHIGVAAPGSVNPQTGVITYANNLPFRHTPVGEMLTNLLGMPCTVGNDANVAAYGEWMAGAGQGARTLIAVTLGTGVGGGVIIDGKIYDGFNHIGAELGHMIIQYDGEMCTCGTKGCWEAYASATALIRQTRTAMEQERESAMWEICGGDLAQVSGRTAFDAMRAGDPAGTRVVDQYIGYIACGLVSIINIFQPQYICIGGGICNEGDTLMIPLKEKVYRNIYNRNAQPEDQTVILRAALGNDAGIIGAALLE